MTAAVSLHIVAGIFLVIAGAEAGSPEFAENFFKRIIKSKYLRLLGAWMFFIVFLLSAGFLGDYRFRWLPLSLILLYSVSGLWILIKPESFREAFKGSYLSLPHAERRRMTYVDCAIRSIIAILFLI